MSEPVGRPFRFGVLGGDGSMPVERWHELARRIEGDGFSTLLVGALLTTGRHTVANVLRTLRHLAPGHRTSYQRVLSRAPWSGLALGCALVRFLLDHVVPDGPVALVGDDTVDGHKGEHVHGKARHRDPVRSTPQIPSLTCR